MNDFTKRVMMSTTGVVTCGIAVGMFKFAAMGVDPFQSLMSGIDAAVPAVRFGTLYVAVNAVLLLFAFTADRTKTGLATFINLFLLGYITEFSQGLCEGLLPDASAAARCAVLAAAVILLCLASSLYFTADLGVSTYDAVSLIWSEKQQRIPFAACRVACDICCVILGAALLELSGSGAEGISANIGAGTVITAFFMGPLIEFFNVHLARPLITGRKDVT